jgi:uncharacterized membrane protein
MAKLDSEDIYLVSQHCNLSPMDSRNLLARHVYNDVSSWKKFLRIFFISVGTAMLAAGIIMFFAYNWNSIGKFSKIGVIEALIVIAVSLVLGTKVKDDVKNIILTGSAILVGVLFAVFGQIYQTGANAYDFFLGWLLSVTLWVFVSNFAPLWLIYVALVNTTIVLYSEQVAGNWSTVLVYMILFVVNLLLLLGFIWLCELRQMFKMPAWFFKTVAIAAVLCSTLGITNGIFGEPDRWFVILLFITAVTYAAAVMYGLKKKRAFYLSLVAFSLVVIVSDLILHHAQDAGGFLLTFLFVIISVTITIRILISLQKKWTVE